MRAAIYFTPPPQSPLVRAAALWLGRDAFSGVATRPANARTDSIVVDAARYGFHATLKAPFRLVEGQSIAGLEKALSAFARERQRIVLPEIGLTRLGAFFAMTPSRKTAALTALEGDIVTGFDHFRATLSATEIARRHPERLTSRQRGYLGEWGYPYVLDEYRFHMTLTDAVRIEDAGWVESELREQFSSFVGQPLAIDSLALFVEPEPGASFSVHSLHSFNSQPLSKSA